MSEGDSHQSSDADLDSDSLETFCPEPDEDDDDSAPPPPPLPPPPHPPAAGRGWRGVRGVAAYDALAVGDYGTIKINLNPRSMSLDAHCSQCGAKKDKRFLPHPRRHEAPQGRPCGALIAWLRACPGTSPHDHKALYNAEELTHARRSRARAWGNGLGTLDEAFDRERPPWPSEDSDEPDGLP